MTPIGILLVSAYALAVIFKTITTVPYKTLYFWHPIAACAAIVFAFLGVHQTQKARGLKPAVKEGRIQIHALLIWLAVFAFLGAGTTIYLNKEAKGKPHATSLHGKMGFFVNGFFLLSALGPAVMYNLAPAQFYKNIKMHRTGGYIGLLAALGVHVSAVVNGYTGFRGEGEKYALLGLLASATISLLMGSRGKAAKPKAKSA